VHTPVWDWLFGTYYMPGRWPKDYGLADGNRVPDTFTRQFLFPFRRRDSKK
jgi:sterol desaturase/sphingolipid hydroxylase (fatty acid hydroxylase superfamily)